MISEASPTAAALSDFIDQLSSVTLTDWAKIKMTLFAIENKEYQCSHCLNRYKGRADEAKMVEANCKAKACKEIRVATFMHDKEREVLYRTCPGNFVFPEVLDWLESYRAYQRGILPFSGALTDQPNKVVEAFRVFDKHFALKEIEERRKLERARGQRA